METSPAKFCICPYCGYAIDMATGPGLPGKNDISICLKCTGLMQFNSDLTLRKIDEQAYIDLINDEEALAKVNEYRKALSEYIIP